MRALALASALVAVMAAPTAVAQTSPSAYTSATRYDPARRVVGTIAPDPDGAGPIAFAAVRNTYDAAGRLTKVETGELAGWQTEGVLPSAWSGFTVFRRVETTYDAMDRKLLEVTWSGGPTGGAAYSATQFSYDAVGRLECTAVRMNPAVYASLPASACTLGTQGSQGPDRITRQVYDAADQVLQVQRAVGTPLQQSYASYTYNQNGKQLSVTDANGNRAGYTYDGFDRQVQWNMPSPISAGTTSSTDYEAYGYDAQGNRTSVRRRDGRTLTFTYDALKRMTSKVVPDACVSGYACTAVPASATRDVYYSYDLMGHQTAARFDSASGADGMTSTWDALGRQLSSTTAMGGVSRTLSYQYDADGGRTRITYPDGNYVTLVYDGLDRVTTFQQNGSLSIATVTYDNQGRRAGDTRLAVNTAYGYDAVSRPTSLADNLAGTSADVTTTLAYNPSSQIVTRTRDNASYAFGGYVSVNRSYAVNGLNQYATAGPATFGYDSNGNLTADGTSSYTYDAESRLVSTSTGATLSYDALGRLYQTSSTSMGTTTFLYDGDALVAQYNSTGTLLRRYVHGNGDDDPMIWYEGATLNYPRSLQVDTQGSVVSVADASGNVVGSLNSYDEYGIPSATNSGQFQYTGQAWIPELGMYYYKARIYSPTLGRFLQTDPIGYADQVNLYAYVGNDPVDGRDPSGMRDIFIGGAWDKNGTEIVYNYAFREALRRRGRDVEYFSWADTRGINRALERPLHRGEPLNVIGHSLGGSRAIEHAGHSGVHISNLISVDPVGATTIGLQHLPNVDRWTNLLTSPHNPDSSDLIAGLGREVLGYTWTRGANEQIHTDLNHGDFLDMAREVGIERILDQSYEPQAMLSAGRH